MKWIATAFAICLISGCLQCDDPTEINLGQDHFLRGQWEGLVWPLNEPPIPVSLQLSEDVFVLNIHFDDFEGVISGIWGTRPGAEGLHTMQWGTQCSNATDLIQSRNITWGYTYSFGIFTFAGYTDMRNGQGHPDQTGPFYVLERAD